MPVHYFDYSIDKTAEPYSKKEFGQKIKEVLNDPRGWRKYGHTFEHVTSGDTSKGPVLQIILCSGVEAKKRCGSSLGGFSCYVHPAYTIYMNLDNWNGGSKSKLPVDRYRTYVINHEVGHSLGLDHPDGGHTSHKDPYCLLNPGKEGSVMTQMTRGPDWVAPCIENEWPLDPVVHNEFADGRKLNLEEFTGGGNGNQSRYSIAFLVILAIIIIALTIVCGVISTVPDIWPQISNWLAA